MRIAICDDEPRLLSRVCELLSDYRLPDNSEFSFDTFSSAVDLMAAMPKGNYDALILDILMPGFTGMDAAHEIRETNSSVNIIFLTSSPEFAVESYRVHAFDYLMKPVDRSDLFNCLDRLYQKLGNELPSLAIDTSRKKCTIPYSSIEFIAVNNRTIEFHLIDGSSLEITGHLIDYESQLLNQPGYIKVHRSYVVNMKRMKSLVNQVFITMSGKQIPIARGLSKDIKQAYISYMVS